MVIWFQIDPGPNSSWHPDMDNWNRETLFCWVKDTKSIYWKCTHTDKLYHTDVWPESEFLRQLYNRNITNLWHVVQFPKGLLTKWLSNEDQK